MTIVTTIHDLSYLTKLLSVYDGVVIGESQFGTRLTHSFSEDDLIETCLVAKATNKTCYVMANKVLEERELASFSSFIERIAPVATGIIVGDLGAFQIMKDHGFENLAIYHPETLLVNQHDFNMLSLDGAQGAFVAREITLEEVKGIAESKAYALFMTGHGHLGMFYSRRHLISNFIDQYHLSHQEIIKSTTLTLEEAQRPDLKMPIIEDIHGTHVFRSQVFASLPYLDALRPVVDVMMIDTIFKDDAYAYRLASLYQGQSLSVEAKSIQNDYDEIWDDGLLMTKTSERR
jgi:U32 family peptidase